MIYDLEDMNSETTVMKAMFIIAANANAHDFHHAIFPSNSNILSVLMPSTWPKLLQWTKYSPLHTYAKSAVSVSN